MINKYTIGIVVLIIICFIIWYFYNKDKFQVIISDYKGGCKDTIISVSKSVTSKDENILSTGIAQKIKINDKYHYIYEFNLPLSTNSFVFSNPEATYDVALNIKSDINNIEKVGSLKRDGDGFYRFEYVSDIDYHSTSIIKSDTGKVWFTKDF